MRILKYNYSFLTQGKGVETFIKSLNVSGEILSSSKEIWKIVVLKSFKATINQ